MGVKENLHFPIGLLVKLQSVVHEKSPESLSFPLRYVKKTIVVLKYKFNNRLFDDVNGNPHV